MSGEPDPSDLSGFWVGIYEFPVANMNAVKFDAVITDVGGLLSGEIIEHTPDDPTVPGGQLFSSLSGKRDGSDVLFLKIYEQLVEHYDEVHYVGTVNNTGDVIKGTWTVPTTEQYEGWSGWFTMNRARPLAKKTEIREKEKLPVK